MPVALEPESAASRPAFKRRGHIVLALLAMLVIVGLGPLATMAWKLINTNREALQSTNREVQGLLASSIAHGIDLQIDSLNGQVNGVAQTLGAVVRRHADVRPEKVRVALADVAHGGMAHIRYSYFAGDRVQSISAGELSEELEPMIGAAVRRVAEIQAARGGGSRNSETLQFPPVILDSIPPRAMMVTAAPVFSGGKFLGVVTGLIDVETVWQTVTQHDHSGYEVYAVDPDAGLLASRRVEGARPGRSMDESPLVQRFLSSDDRARETAPFTVVQNGEAKRYLGTLELTRQGWGVVVQAREKQVYLPVREIVRSTLTWAVGALALAGLMAIVFARSLSGPINRLAAASRAFAKGDFSARVSVRSRNEVGELAHTFNIMASEIESYIRKLRKALKENNELFLGTIRALAQAIDAKDPYTRGHSVRVNRYAVILGRQLGLPDAELRDIHVASLLHDVGKIAIDDAILKKPGALTDDEFKIMKTHTTRGAEIMEPIRQMENMLPGLRWHHERMTGGGYPDGLAGERIPLMARIIAVADTFDAITTARPYQNPMSYEAAVARVNELKGAALDEKVVEAFNRACNAGLIRLESTEDREVPEPTPA